MDRPPSALLLPLGTFGVKLVARTRASALMSMSYKSRRRDGNSTRLGDRMSAVEPLIFHVVKVHRPFLHLVFCGVQARNDPFHHADPSSILPRVNHHHGRRRASRSPHDSVLVGRRVAAFLGIGDNHVRFFCLFRGRPSVAPSAFRPRSASSFPFSEKTRVRVHFISAIGGAPANEHTEWLGSEGTRRCRRARRGEKWQGDVS